MSPLYKEILTALDCVPFEPSKLIVAPGLAWQGGKAPSHIKFKGRDIPLIEDPKHPRDRVSIIDGAVIESQDVPSKLSEGTKWTKR